MVIALQKNLDKDCQSGNIFLGEPKIIIVFITLVLHALFWFNFKPASLMFLRACDISCSGTQGANT
jgi:hypothetical protein